MPSSTHSPSSISQHARTPRPPLRHLSLDEQQTWLQHTRAQLQGKLQRERAFLDRRAGRGISTPLDVIYEADQLLQADLLALLEDISICLQECP